MQHGTIWDISGRLRTGIGVDVAPHTEDLDLASVHTSEEFSALLRTVHRRADKPSLRTLEALSRHGPAPLSKTVVSEMLKGTRFPRKAVVLAFLQACGIHGEQVDPWLRAWERIAERAGPHGADPAAAVASDGSNRATADGSEASRLREQVSRLSADNAGLRAQMAALRHAMTPDTARPGDGEGNRTVRNAAVSRRELGVLLRALREEKGITFEQAAERLLCSPGKISRMESSFRSGTLRDVRDLCDLYEVTDARQRERLMTLARDSKAQGPLQSYYPQDIATFVGLENDAASIKVYQGSLMPGLLQTAEYARAVLRDGWYSFGPEEAERRVEMRLARQRLLTRPDPPDFLAIIDEAVLRRLVGGPAVMMAQIAHMIEISALANVSFKVIPFTAGPKVWLDGNFAILEFTDPIPGLAFSEKMTASHYIEKPADVDSHRDAFEILRAVALSEDESLAFAKQIIRVMENQA